MIAEWREKYWEMHSNGQSKEEFFASHSWHQTPSEYSILFEALYDQASQRREYIEQCVSCGRPSWGYIYLVNLLKNSVFNTIFTTNFDDLLNEACYLYSDSVRPIVCSHDSSIRFVRLSSKRPKIVKLHGDFLFDNIKNTVRELETLEDNMKDKFKQCAAEYGMIIVGYAGNDRSVMESLNALLRQDSNFPHGIYWCIRKDSRPSRQVIELCRFSRFNLVEIDGFDEFFAEIHEHLGLQLQPEMSDPYAALADKLNGLINATGISKDHASHKIIQRDVSQLALKISKLANAKSANPEKPKRKRESATPEASHFTRTVSLPYELLAQVERRAGRLDEARTNLVRQLEAKPQLRTYATAFKLLRDEWDEDFSQKVLASLDQNSHLFDDDPNEVLNFSVDLISAGKHDYAGKVMAICEERYQKGETKAPLNTAYFIINKAQIRKHKGEELDRNELKELKTILSLTTDPVARFGIYVVCDQHHEAEVEFISLVDSGTESPDRLAEMLSWPITQLLPADIRDRMYNYLTSALKSQINSKKEPK